jgi:hypothetical protein
MSETKKPMREAMPTVAAGLDSLRAAFGADGINESIRAGMRGEPNKFVVLSRDRVIGTQFDNPVRLRGESSGADNKGEA